MEVYIGFILTPRHFGEPRGWYSRDDVVLYVCVCVCRLLIYGRGDHWLISFLDMIMAAVQETKNKLAPPPPPVSGTVVGFEIGFRGG